MRAHSRSPHIICPRHSSLSWCQPTYLYRAESHPLPCLMSGVKDHHHPDHHPDELWSTHDNTSNDQPGLRTNLVTHVFLVGQQSSEKERFYPSCKSNFCRFNFSKICSNFQPICSLDIWLTIKLPFCPSLWPPAVPLQAAASCSNIFFSRDLQFSAAVYCPNYGRSLKS